VEFDVNVANMLESKYSTRLDEEGCESLHMSSLRMRRLKRGRSR
jgi:hypothetical protein